MELILVSAKQIYVIIFQSVAHKKKWIIKAVEVAPDHLHLLVEYDPNYSIFQVVKAFKGRSLDI